MEIEDAYKRIQKEIPLEVDSLEVVKKINEFRQFWKPIKVNVVLLAESHVHTPDQEMRHQQQLPTYCELPGYPFEHVRFVYCLGYGENALYEENDLLKNPLENRGTPQFWKIFFSCCNNISSNDNFKPILKGGTPLFKKRLNNKIELLKKLQEKGIWLVDASIIGLYPPNGLTPEKKKDILKKCWDIYTEPLLTSLKPKHIICIGKGVGDILADELKKVKIPFNIIYQPQARRSNNQHLDDLKNCFSICEKYCGE